MLYHWANRAPHRSIRSKLARYPWRLTHSNHNWQPTVLIDIRHWAISLVPRPLPLFQCCMLDWKVESLVCDVVQCLWCQGYKWGKSDSIEHGQIRLNKHGLAPPTFHLYVTFSLRYICCISGSPMFQCAILKNYEWPVDKVLWAIEQLLFLAFACWYFFSFVTITSSTKTELYLTNNNFLIWSEKVFTTFPASMNYPIIYIVHTSTTLLLYLHHGTTVTPVLETSTKPWDVEREFSI